jgi:hypothetical protein
VLNLTLNYSISSSTKRKKGKDKKFTKLGNGGREDDLFGANINLNDNRQSV